MSPSSRWLGISRAACRENVVVGSCRLAVGRQLRPVSTARLFSTSWFRSTGTGLSLAPAVARRYGASTVGDRVQGQSAFVGPTGWMHQRRHGPGTSQPVKTQPPASRSTCNVQRARLHMHYVCIRKVVHTVSLPTVTFAGNASCMRRSALPQPLNLCFASAKETSPCEAPVRAAGSQAGSDEYGRCQ